MKTIIIGFAIAVAALTACNNGDKPKETTTSSDTAQATGQAPVPATKAASVTELIANYLQLKNALTNDDGKDAATAGNALSETVQKVDEGSLTAAQKKVFDDVKDDIKENAEHISTNGGKIAHQREHLDMLSKDMYDVVKAFGSRQALYQDHCPMYNGGKGANWLSEVKEIKNPYLGKKTPTCGSVKETMQ